MGLGVIDVGRTYRQLHYDGRELEYRAGIYVRAFTVNTRLFNLRELPAGPLGKYLTAEPAWLSECEGHDFCSPAKYLFGFASVLGQQAARMQRLGYLHGALHAQQVTPDATVCDFEHETISGFSENQLQSFTIIFLATLMVISLGPSQIWCITRRMRIASGTSWGKQD